MLPGTSFTKFVTAQVAGQKPLTTLISNVAIALARSDQQYRLARILAHGVIALLFLIPAGLVYVLGKLLCHLSALRINHDALNLVPAPFEVVGSHDATEFVAPIDTHCKQVHLTAKQTEIIQNMYTRVTATPDRLTQLGLPIIYADNNSQRELFCAEMKVTLNDIFREFESKNVTGSQKRDILIELSVAGTRCHPTWLEVATNKLTELRNGRRAVVDKVLVYVQEYKESIVKDFGQEVGMEWHMLNFVRKLLGHELGLQTALAAYDPFASDEDSSTPRALLKWMCLQSYRDVNRLIMGIQAQINMQPYDQRIYNYLKEQVASCQGVNVEEWVATHFYDEEYKLTFEGVSFLLHKIGVLQ